MFIPYIPDNDKFISSVARLKSGDYVCFYTKGALDEALKYKEVAFTTAGTFYFTVPDFITRIRVAVCGGGGGCTIVAEDDNDTHTNHLATDGGTSSFGDLLSASGGGAGNAQCNSGGAWGVAGTGGSPNGRDGVHVGGYKYTGSSQGGRGFALSFDGTSGNYGNGGYADTTAHAGSSNAGGGGGGFATGYFNVTPHSTYSVTVGSFGANRCTYWEGGTVTWHKATSGFVLIAYGGDIENG